MGIRVGKTISGRLVVSWLGFTVSCVRKLCGVLSLKYLSRVDNGEGSWLSYIVCAAGTAHT